MMLSMIVVMSARAQASGKRLLEVLDAELDIVDRPQTTRPAWQAGKVEFCNVDFKYDLSGSGENVLSGIRFTVQPGQVVGIVGGTGTGKTTLARHMAQHYAAIHLRIDTIEQALRELCRLDVTGEGYRLAYRIAADNLQLGLNGRISTQGKRWSKPQR